MKILLTISGIFLTAISHSICCIIPSLTLLLGTTTSIVSFHFLDDYKWLFLAVNLLLLSLGFYNLYFKKPATQSCDCDESTEKKKLARKRVSLWVAATFSILIMFLPSAEHTDGKETVLKTEIAENQ